jgi:hypothetical protein
MKVNMMQEHQEHAKVYEKNDQDTGVSAKECDTILLPFSFKV